MQSAAPSTMRRPPTLPPTAVQSSALRGWLSSQVTDPERLLLWVPFLSGIVSALMMVGFHLVTPIYSVLLLALFGPGRTQAALLAAAPLTYALFLLSVWLTGFYLLPHHPATPMALLTCVLHLPTVYLFLFMRRRPGQAARNALLLMGVFVLGALPHTLSTFYEDGTFDGPGLPVALLYANTVLIAGLLSFSRARSQLERERAEARAMRILAHLDPLTGLHNRRALEHDLRGTGAAADPRPLLAVVDVDCLKALNDALGHAAGDDLLRRFGEGFAREAELHGRAYRISGDEFALLLNGWTPQKVERLVGEVTYEVREVYAGAAASVGVALWQADEGPDAWLSRADREMYRHKQRTL